MSEEISIKCPRTFKFFCSELGVIDDEINCRITTTIVPALLELIESQLKQIPDTMIKKTRDLADHAKGVIEAKEGKPAIIPVLLTDITEMPKKDHLKASFEATSLNFMGE